MITFEIEIPDSIYQRGIAYAQEAGITFSELCSLGVLELMKCSEEELEEMAKRKEFERG